MTARESRESGRKEQILESALHLFLEEGYDSTSMRKIADAAGCAVGLAYHYFETKDEMFAQTLDYFFQPYEQEMRVLAAQKDKDLYGLLEDCFSYVVKQSSAFRKNHPGELHWMVRQALRERALELLESVEPDLILLDIMFPDISGVDLCLQIRNKVAAPILFMSCKSEEIDKIIALSVGGDDYITKPFNSGELIARIKAHLRRERRARQAEAERNPVYECRGLEVDETARTVQLDGQPVNVTTKEFDILLTLIRSPKRVFSMDQLFELVWKEESLAGDSRTIMVYISNIRKKIEKEDQKFIYNIRGAGYKFHDEVTVRSR